MEKAYVRRCQATFLDSEIFKYIRLRILLCNDERVARLGARHERVVLPPTPRDNS
jgi:hypothetical protein